MSRSSAAEPAHPPAGSAGAVAWERLRLEGFGRHRRLDATFGDGLRTWVAPNESGKSTAVMGLLATLYGLPHVQDVSALSWARFRPWSGGPHRGELTLRARDGLRYTVTREFDRHHVRVVRHDDDERDELVLEATHNPNARREASPYGPWLERSVGLTDLSVVLATFVVPQSDGPGAPHRVGEEVQALVSGAGGAGHRGALEALADALRERTRSLRPLDVGLADGRNDRILERLEAAIESDRRALESGRAAADGTQAAQRRLALAEEAHRAARTTCDRLKRSAEAQRVWIDRRDAARRDGARAAELRRAAERVRGASAVVERAERELAGTWPAFADAPPDAPEALDALVAARARLADAEARRASAERALAAQRSEAAAALAALPIAEATLPEGGRDWSGVGVPAAPAVARLRRAATALVRQVDTVRAAEARYAEVAAELAPVAVFRDVDDATRELLEGFGPRARALAERLARTRTRHDELAERMRRHSAAFAEVRALGDEEVAALQEFERARERRRDPWAWRIALGVTGAVIGYFAVPGILAVAGQGTHDWAPWLGAATLATVAVLLVPGRDETRAARARLAELGIDGDDEEVRQRLRRREAFEAQRAQVEGDARAYEEVRDELVAAEEDALAFRDAVQPYARALQDVAGVDEAFARWTRLAPRVEREREALEAQVRYLADVEPHEVAGARAARGGEAAIELARFAAFQGVVDADPDDAPERLGLLALADWLERLSDATWERWEAAAAEYDAAVASATEAAGERRRTADRWADRLRAAETAVMEARRDADEAVRLEAEVTHALAWLWPRLPPAPPAAAQPAADGPRGGGDDDVTEALIGDEEAAEAPAAGDGAFATAQALIGEHEVVEPGADGRASPARSWDARDLRRGWDERRRAEDALHAERRTLEAQLAAADAASVDDVDRAAERAAVAAAAALTRWQDLTAEHPDLPPADHELADVEARFRELEQEARRAEEREHATHDEVLAAQRALARAQGAEVVNVAALELAIAAAESEAARVRGEVEALALAHRELSAAVDDFRREHRERLEDRASDYLQRFSGAPRRRVVLDEDFAACVHEPSGATAVPAQLSHGARDQLALALRLAVADVLGDDVRLPLVFDDPFLNWDEERSKAVRNALHELAQERQVVVLSHRRAVRDWGPEVERHEG